MSLLLPCYPELRAKFAEDKREGRSFEALELFFRHFLREGSVFSAFGLQNLHEKRILTQLHLDDIQCQYRSISEDLDLLDEAIVELDNSVDSDGPDEPGHEGFLEPEEFDVSPETDKSQEAEETGEPQGSDDTDDHESSDYPDWMDDIANDPFQSDLRTAIKRRDFTTVRQMIEQSPGVADVKILSRAIHFYDETVFRLLLERGAHGLGADVTTKLLYRASKAGHIGAVKLLLKHSVNKENKAAGRNIDSTTALAGAASGGRLNVVRYLVEKRGANINGDGRRSPLSRAFKHRHREIAVYLLGAGAILPPQDYQKPFLRIDRQIDRDNLAKFITKMPMQAKNILLSTASSQGHVDMANFLVALGAEPNSTQKERGKTTDPSISSLWRFLLKQMLASAVPDAMAAIQAQQRRTMIRRLLAELKTSRRALLAAGARPEASAALKDFVGQTSTGSSVWTWGTRAIRDLSEGYMPSSLADIVSALQVANAMRVAVSSSVLACSKKE